MKNLKDILTINEDYKRAKAGNVLEIELRGDGHFYWHTQEDDDWEDFKDMKDWEIRKYYDGQTFFIKLGNIKDIEKEI